VTKKAESLAPGEKRVYEVHEV